MDLLRFITAGSVDDGKSTLIGRLLFDSGAVARDLVEAIERSSEKSGSDQVNLALLTDGLKAEREQGITIDVAYKYFSTEKRKFIIADAPGHVQYTRNMVTGASNVDAAVILVDARQGIVEQTRRHSFLASLLGIPHVILAINKMDLVDHSEDRFNEIVQEYEGIKSRMHLEDVIYIPVSALSGENVARKSENMPWFKGQPLLEVLETLPHRKDVGPARFPVQWVIRPHSDEHHDYRGYAGQLQSGVLEEGQEVTLLPSGGKSRIKSIELGGERLERASAPMSVTIQLEDDIDVSRGDMIVSSEDPALSGREFVAHLCWMDHSKLNPRNRFVLQHTTRRSVAMVQSIEAVYDIHSLEKESRDSMELNDIGLVRIKTAERLSFDEYKKNRRTGSFILIDESSNSTVAAGMISAG
ncbi:MAG: sulfate adenylyltransferase [Spirochaetaceae bacterium]|nr:sulfate adenylyltransferase [Spirochaetaceae bacterium]|tara:strand:- start:32346 stop:33584 length:1239 start_codon:yes stop_codon:yes gene_type:complete